VRIAVIGATRGIGRALVDAALAEGHYVTALARRPEQLAIRNPLLRVVAGDALDLDAIREVVQGQDVVCSCLGTRQMLKPTTLFSRAAQNLAAALEPEQLLIAVTGIGAGDSRGHGGFLYDYVALPLMLGRMYADKEREERIIRERVARWIIVRPGFLTNGPRTGRWRALVDLRGVRAGKISRADVADFILAQAKSPRFIGQTPLLTY